MRFAPVETLYLLPFSPTIGLVSTRSPCNDEIQDEPMTTRDQSLWSFFYKLTSRGSCRFCLPHWLCQGKGGCRVDMFEPQPSSYGRYSHGKPGSGPKRFTERDMRLSIGSWPGWRNRPCSTENRGSTISPNSSGYSRFVVTAPSCVEMLVADWLPSSLIILMAIF